MQGTKIVFIILQLFVTDDTVTHISYCNEVNSNKQNKNMIFNKNFNRQS